MDPLVTGAIIAVVEAIKKLGVEAKDIQTEIEIFPKTA